MYCLDSKIIVFNEHDNVLLPTTNMNSSLERVILTSWNFVFNQVYIVLVYSVYVYRILTYIQPFLL